jgi:hypothetical protein
MIVYNTDSNCIAQRTTSTWLYLYQTGGPNSNINWALTGNAGITAGTNFIGTTDANDFVTKTNSTEIMRVTSGGNVGIGITTPGSKLDVKGTIRLSGATSGYVGFQPAAVAGSTTYILPTADGTNGQALTTNGAGTLSWATSLPQIIVSATRNAAYVLATAAAPAGGAFASVLYNTTTINVGTAYNTATGIFTAPATGTYQILFSNEYSGTTLRDHRLISRIIVNGATETEVGANLSPYDAVAKYMTLHGTTIVTMTSGQTASIQVGGALTVGTYGLLTPLVAAGQHNLKIVRLN